MSLPKDPVMMLGVINTQLRDNYKDLDALCDAYEASRDEITEKLATIGYKYDEAQNQFK